MTEDFKEFEDMQEKYRDKKPKPVPVPLAADAAHLLSEYLDNLAIQFVKAGVDEPYRITQEHEEIFVQELQRKGGSSKLTYEVTAKVLEGYGTPAELVRNYISQHQPETRNFVDRSWRDMLKDNSWWDIVAKVTIYLWFIGMFFTILFGFLTNAIPMTHPLPEPMITVFVLFAILELSTGITGTVIESENYEMLRQITRFSANVTALLTTWSVFGYGYGYQVVAWFWMVIVWGVAMGIGTLKDNTNLLKSSATTRKPPARFLLPSYLLFGLAVLMACLLLASSDGQYIYGELAILFVATMITAFLSMLIDARGKYPLSLKKLGYTLIGFTFFPFHALSWVVRQDYYDEFGNYWTDQWIEFDTAAIFSVLLVWVIAVFLTVIILFRDQISEQLGEYRLQLEEYQVRE